MEILWRRTTTEKWRNKHVKEWKGIYGILQRPREEGSTGILEQGRNDRNRRRKIKVKRLVVHEYESRTKKTNYLRLRFVFSEQYQRKIESRANNGEKSENFQWANFLEQIRRHQSEKNRKKHSPRVAYRSSRIGADKLGALQDNSEGAVFHHTRTSADAEAIDFSGPMSNSSTDCPTMISTLRRQQHMSVSHSTTAPKRLRSWWQFSNTPQDEKARA